MDSLHKVVNPSAYSCKLCELTYSAIEEKKVWKKFHKDLDAETEFLHKDEFQKLYASKFGFKFEFPLILAQNNKGLEVLISKNEFSDIRSTEELMHLIESRIEDN